MASQRALTIMCIRIKYMGRTEQKALLCDPKPILVALW